MGNILKSTEGGFLTSAYGRQQDLQAALAAVPWLLACSVSGGLKCVDARALSSFIGGRNAAAYDTLMVLDTWLSK